MVYIQSVALLSPPSVVSARTRQKIDCPGAGVGAVSQGSDSWLLVTVLLQYHVAASLDVKLLLLHCTKYLVNTSEHILSFAVIASHIHEVQLFDWNELIVHELFIAAEIGVGVGVFVAPCVMVTLAFIRHRT